MIRADGTSFPELKALRIRYGAVTSGFSVPALCWEQAQALINLADGVIEPEASAGARQPTRNDVPTHSTPRPRLASLEPDASVAARQHEMLRRVLAALDEKKGASLPVRAPSVSRPTLAALTDQQSVPSSLDYATRSVPKVKLASSPGRKSSFRFRHLIFRLWSKSTPEIAIEPSLSDTPTSSASDWKPGQGAESDKDSDGEDWDREFFGFPEGVEQDYAPPLHLDGKMALTSEGIPHLLAKADELRQACLRDLALL